MQVTALDKEVKIVNKIQPPKTWSAARHEMLHKHWFKWEEVVCNWGIYLECFFSICLINEWSKYLNSFWFPNLRSSVFFFCPFLGCKLVVAVWQGCVLCRLRARSCWWTLNCSAQPDMAKLPHVFRQSAFVRRKKPIASCRSRGVEKRQWLMDG